ncbi:MAG: hypothetical protein ABH834_07870 [Candidatus Altiarchaeota archaeon]
MTKGFREHKQEAVNTLQASIKVGDADEEILPLLEKINALLDYYTTSSCAGRIVVFQDRGGKFASDFLGKWHLKADASEVLATIKPCRGTLWFRVEPPIIHVGCESLSAAAKMMEAAQSSGFKRTGLQSLKDERYMLEILSTERFDAPIMKDEKMLVSEDYIGFLVGLANEKITKSREKLERLDAAIESF